MAHHMDVTKVTKSTAILIMQLYFSLATDKAFGRSLHTAARF